MVRAEEDVEGLLSTTILSIYGVPASGYALCRTSESISEVGFRCRLSLSAFPFGILSLKVRVKMPED
jgi:hypothetical protein